MLAPDSGWGHKQITDALREESDIHIGHFTISNHRRGLCRCGTL